MNRLCILLIGNFLSSFTGTRSVGEELSLHLSAIGWKTIETSRQPMRFFRLLDMLCTVIIHRKEYQVAYVEVYSGLAFIWAEIVAQLLFLLHKPVVLALHGGSLVEFAQRYPVRVANLLQKGKIILTPSLFLLTGLKPINSEIRYLPNAIDVSHYEFRLRDHPAPKLIWLRAFHEIYQPELAIKTISFLIKEFNKIIMTMIGPDKRNGSFVFCLKLAESLGVASHINFIGSIPKTEVPAWLAKGDVFLNTTRVESFGVSVMEAALVGLPIVTTNVGELSLLWENETTAMLVSPNDPKEMANAIQRILTETDLAGRLSLNARKKAEEFDWSVILPQWEALFSEVISTPS